MQIKDLALRLITKYRSMWRWGLVGTLTAVIDYFIFLFLYSITPSVLFANFFSGLASLTFNYLAHYFWSFKSASDHKQSGARYLINLVVIWSLGTVFLKILITSGIDPHIAKIIPVLVTAPGSYISLNYFVFTKVKKQL
jgi:putative flippase GtrA